MFHKSVKYVPSWFPGAGFKRFAAKGHVVTTKTVNKPFNEVKRRMVRFRSFPIIVGVPWVTRFLADARNRRGVVLLYALTRRKLR